MGPPPRSFAADANNCIMVWISMIHRIQVCGAMIRASRQAPLGRYRHTAAVLVPTSLGLAAVLATVKGKSLRDGLRPPVTAAVRSGQPE
jgi:hypothetical protein